MYAVTAIPLRAHTFQNAERMRHQRQPNMLLKTNGVGKAAGPDTDDRNRRRAWGEMNPGLGGKAGVGNQREKGPGRVTRRGVNRQVRR
jgi:hypothetical protein